MNGDPSFNKVVTLLAGKADCDTRTRLYVAVCVLVRAGLYSLVWLCRDRPWVPWVVGAFSIVTILNLGGSVCAAGAQWWSKRFQLGIAVALLSVCLLGDKVPSAVIPALLATSLVGGIAQRISA